MPADPTVLDLEPALGGGSAPSADAGLTNDRELAGLDALELAGAGRRSLASRLWSAAWLAFSLAEGSIRRRRGLVDAAA